MRRIGTGIDRVVARLPAWVVVVVALVCVVVGVYLTLRPFSSVEALVLVASLAAIVTGVLTLVSNDKRSDVYRWLIGFGWIVLGVVVLVWPGLGVETLAVVVGVALIVDGIVDIVRALTGRVAERAAELLGGAASIIFGVLALTWPDVTVLLVAVLFGARTVLFGLSHLLAVVQRWWRPAAEAAAPKARGWLGRSVRLVTRGVALVVALALLAVSAAFNREVAAVPEFYDTPATVPGTPGELLRSEPLDSELPDNARGWVILYSTTTTNGEPAVGSAFALAPKDPPPGPRPVILWTHGTVGINRPCAPSLFDDVTKGIPSIPQMLDQGWVMVAPDYTGMGTEGVFPYLVGKGQAYSSLDAVRAARKLSAVTLSDQTVVWGHSQGGNAALWTRLLAAEYAPDVPLEGVAALAPATDLVALSARVQGLGSGVGAIVLGYTLTAYSGTYDDIRFDDYVRPGARVQVREAAERCLGDPGLVVSVLLGSGGGNAFSTDLTSGAMGDRLRENTPTAAGAIPLLVGAGTSDEVINIAINEGWVQQQCAAGYRLDFRRYPDRTHMGVLEADSPLTEELIAWTADRFAGRPATSTC